MMSRDPVTLLHFDETHSPELVADILLNLAPSATIRSNRIRWAHSLPNAETRLTFAYCLSGIEGCEIEFCSGTSGFDLHPCVEHVDL